MHTYRLSLPEYGHDVVEAADFGLIIQLARQRAHALDRVVYIDLDEAQMGCPNRWAISPRGYLTVEGVRLPMCAGCGDF